MRSQRRSGSRHPSHRALAAALLAGCGWPPPSPLGSATADFETSSSSSSAAEGVPATPPDAGVDDDVPMRGGGLFLQERDLGPRADCGLLEQDCPAGEKCNAYANDGGGSWNARGCFPIDPDPDEIGEPCTVVDSGVSGMDSCGLGGMCWDVDPETNVGVCVAFCNGTEANPTCTDPTLHCVGREFMICLPSCCPLEQSCDEGQACYPIGDSFECAPDVSGEEGEFGDSCEFINVCDPGLFCAGPDLVPACEGSSGCCTPYCEIGSSSCAALHPDLECIPWFEEGHAPFGEEHVGGCMLPEGGS